MSRVPRGKTRTITVVSFYVDFAMSVCPVAISLSSQTFVRTLARSFLIALFLYCYFSQRLPDRRNCKTHVMQLRESNELLVSGLPESGVLIARAHCPHGKRLVFTRKYISRARVDYRYFDCQEETCEQQYLLNIY